MTFGQIFGIVYCWVRCLYKAFFHSPLIITLQKELWSYILKEPETQGPIHSVPPLRSYSLTQTVPQSVTERYQTTEENTAQAWWRWPATYFALWRQIISLSSCWASCELGWRGQGRFSLPCTILGKPKIESNFCSCRSKAGWQQQHLGDNRGPWRRAEYVGCNGETQDRGQSHLP